MTTATKPRFIVRDEELTIGAPEVRCSGCEEMFAQSETVIVRSPKVRSDAPCNFNSDDAMCFACAGFLRCTACDEPREDTVWTPEGRMCPECLAENAEDIVNEMLDALFGAPCFDCPRLIRNGLLCVPCEVKARKAFETAEGNGCLRCGLPTRRRWYFCSQECEDAERFAGVR